MKVPVIVNLPERCPQCQRQMYLLGNSFVCLRCGFKKKISLDYFINRIKTFSKPLKISVIEI